MQSKIYLLILLTLLTVSLSAQRRGERPPGAADAQGATTDKQKGLLNESVFSGLKLRNIGPAFTSGRIADIVIHPNDDNVWYLAVGSGGVWKTANSGVTWKPIFDDQPSYSIGCITIDPGNPHTVWVGTGENVGGRHVAFGDGVYKSTDDGATWKNMGLKETQHISKILVHPTNSDIIWVAAQGPLWNKGGERGLYKSTDGGKTWKRTLGDDEWTGVTDIAADPRNPDVLYAATWQRHRTVWAYMGGGPGSGLHRSIDGGETWEKLTGGLPRSSMGKIGLAISPQNPDILYAAIELDRTTGAVYRSANRGASWERMSSTVSGGTGPHYYQELYASPHAFDRLYLMDVRIQVSDDGGRTFRQLQERNKHSDNHAIAFRADDPDYLLVGCDAGIYESFDLAENWRFIDNLPVTQYYKVALDDREPFYHVFGGTQDNGSHGGPSRTDTRNGIRNADWYITLGADGHQSATEPGNPNIGYAETQEGGISRIDRITGEQVFIQPQPGKGEKFERFNWDAPILVSPHKPSRIYFASQRVWRSEDRGDSWTAISGDLTRNQDRMSMPIMGKQQSWDAAWDLKAMSNYNSITSLAESPKQSGLVYAGTDDGLIQVTEDGGATWRKIELGSVSGIPATAFVNDIKADLHDANTVYAAVDNHKNGDFTPYLIKSMDRGRTWSSIRGDLPDKTMVWRMVQDHIAPKLLFAATERGIFFTLDGGAKWLKLGGAPPIAFRDLAIQKRENDLVGASFGRGFFILDDYSVLREISEEKLKQEAALFAARKAWWYAPRSVVNTMGASYYAADNPPFGAVFTYYLKDNLETQQSARKEKERDLVKNNQDVPFPGWDALEAERLEEKPMIWLVIKDSEGNIVRRVEGQARKGLHRTDWDLRMTSKNPISLDPPRAGGGEGGGFRRGGGGVMVTPGSYSVTLVKQVDGVTTVLAGPQNFEVVPLRQGALPGKPKEEMAAFGRDVQALQAAVSAANQVFTDCKNRIAAMQTAATRTDSDVAGIVTQLHTLKKEVQKLDARVNGNQSKEEIGEKNDPTVSSRMFIAMRGLTTYGPTDLHRQSLEIAKAEFQELKQELDDICNNKIPAVERALAAAGAPWIEGQPLQDGKR